MAKQCPRCWEKIDSDATICPHCDYNFKRMAVAADKAESDSGAGAKRSSRSRKDYSETDGTTYIFSFINGLLLLWAVIAVLGGIWNLVSGEALQGAGLVASGLICGIAFYLMRNRQHHGICWLLVLVSGAATLQIPTLVVGVGMAFLVYLCKPYFGSGN